MNIKQAQSITLSLLATVAVAAALWSALPKSPTPVVVAQLGYDVYYDVGTYDTNADYQAGAYDSDSTYQPPQEADLIGKLIDKIINSKP